MKDAMFVTSQIKNVHDSQKWMWTFLAGFSLVVATNSYYDKAGLKSLVENGSQNFFGILNSNFFELTLLYILFLSVLYRMYVGDTRIVDHYYDSVPKTFFEIARDSKEAKNPESNFWLYINSLTPVKIFLDAFGRVIDYTLLGITAICIANQTAFFYSIGFLLTFDALYCLLVLFVFTKSIPRVENEKKRKSVNFKGLEQFGLLITGHSVF